MPASVSHPARRPARRRADRDAGMRVFRAIADPTRRAMLDRLAGGECAAGDLAACGARRMSQPALSQHLAVLRRANLVAGRRDGRRRLYRLHAEPLREIHDWLDHYRVFWDSRLDALGQYLDQSAAQARPTDDDEDR